MDMYIYYNQMKSSKYESMYLPSQWCFRVVLDWTIFCTCCRFGVLSEIYTKHLHINDMTLDNDLGIPNYSISSSKLLLMFRTSNHYCTKNLLPTITTITM